MKYLIKLFYRWLPASLRQRVSFDRRWDLEGGVDDVEVDGINMRDYPDFCDAFIACACWRTTGDALTDGELEALSADSSFVYDRVVDRLY